MKRSIFLLFLFLSLRTIGQFVGGFVSTYGRYSELQTTNPLQESVGIGDFGTTTGNLPLARLHVASFRLGATSTNTVDPFSEGILFRTDGDQSINNSWHLFTGTSATAQTERFRLYTDAGATPGIGLRSFSGPIRMETGNTNIRLFVNGNNTALINGFNIDNSGFVAITNNQAFWTNAQAPRTPYALLHLAGSGGNIQQDGYRPWMRDGLIFTSNGDMSYVGPRGISDDLTEMTIAWSDNSGSGSGPDDLTFRFLDGNGTGTGSGDADGLQIMRMIASDNGRVGIGPDFTTTVRPQRRLEVSDAGANDITNAQLRLSTKLDPINPNAVDFRCTANGNLYINCFGTQERVGIETASPTERLDVNGNLRLRNVPTEASDCVLLGRRTAPGTPADIGVRRLEFNADPLTYLAGNGTWQTIPTGGGGTCTWEIASNNPNGIATGYPGACRPGNVAIGQDQAVSDIDLFIVNNNISPLEPVTRGLVTRSGATLSATGVQGVIATAGAITNTAIYGELPTFYPSGSINYAVRGEIGNASGALTYAVYGAATSAPGTSFAAYFNGNTFSTTGWGPSDAGLKTEISPLFGALDMVQALKVYSYKFDNSLAPQLNLDDKLHYGILAQELQEIMPHAVQEIAVPAKTDSVGNVIYPTTNIMSVNYNEFIGLLIQSTKELNEKVNQLEAQLALCCAANTPLARSLDASSSNNEENKDYFIVLGQNIPNPFKEQTTIPYEVPENTRLAQIFFYSIEGKLVHFENLPSIGKGNVVIHGENLTNGTYTYTLVIDGIPVQTKKMLKQ